MRNARDINAALDQLHAQVWALSQWVVTLAALQPASAVALLSRPAAARDGLLFVAQSDAQLALCVAALQSLNSAFAELRVAMSQQDLAQYTPTPPGPQQSSCARTSHAPCPAVAGSASSISGTVTVPPISRIMRMPTSADTDRVLPVAKRLIDG